MTTNDTIKNLLASDCTSFWLKDAIKAAMKRDIIDALNDAESLVYILRDYSNAVKVEETLNRR